MVPYLLILVFQSKNVGPLVSYEYIVPQRNKLVCEHALAESRGITLKNAVVVDAFCVKDRLVNVSKPKQKGEK